MATKGKTESRTDKWQQTSGPDASAEAYINQWNQLVSTTNWEKGHIICQWREALVAEGGAATEYSDDAWANLVGGVTGQHAGRLRRVHQQFGQVWQEYPGLFWSHFQIAMDWNDAEMWLEGAVQNGWSVSQMRGARWEAHGAPDALKPRDEDVIVAEVDEDLLVSSPRLTPVAASTTAVRTTPDDEDSEALAGDGRAAGSSRESSVSAKRSKGESPAETTAAEPKPRRRPFANLADLPDDVAEAFEQFKLVILAHKLAGWQEIARDDLLAALDALKELAQLPAEG